jgi:ribosome maturation factor RimP
VAHDIDGMDSSTIRERVWALTEPLVGALGLEVIDVQYRPEAGRMVLRLLLDRPEGRVNLDELADVSRQLGDVLEAHDAVAGRYVLECSSPGVERPLRRPDHFRRVVGEAIRLTTREPRDGRRRFRGALEAVTDAGVRLADVDVGPVEVAFEEITEAHTEFDARRALRAGARS